MKSQIHKSICIDQSANKKPFNDVFRPNGVTAALEMVGVGMFLPLLQLLATPESALENSGIVILRRIYLRLTTLSG